MKKITAFILILAVAFTLASCSNLSGCEGIVLGSYIPCFGDVDVRGISTEPLEEDDYGRILYAYRTPFKDIYPFFATAVIIMQKFENDQVYFYEDSFFFIYDYPVNNLSEIDVDSQKINELKVLNDWGEPLDESKMSKRTVTVRPNFSIEKERPELSEHQMTHLEANVRAEIGHDEFDMWFRDYDNESRELYFVNAGEGEYYFVIVSSCEYYSLVKIDDIFDYLGQLSELKRSSGWNYG